MSKLRKNTQSARSKVKKLSQDDACYVLITCKMPSADGKMQVEMTYEGDECLAAYLIESAQEFIRPLV